MKCGYINDQYRGKCSRPAWLAADRTNNSWLKVSCSNHSNLIKRAAVANNILRNADWE